MFNFNPTDAMRRMLQARQRIARRNPFFASLLFNAKLVETDKRQTIVTDGIHVFFNAEYVKENDQYIEGDFLKCVMHSALLHVPRKKYRDLDKWNESCTLSVGPIVHQYFPQHPALMAGDGRFPDKAAEEIYELLEDQEGKGKGKGKQPPKGGEAPGNGEAPGSMVDPAPEDAEAAEQAAKDWQIALANATDKAKKAGNMTGNIERLVEELQPAEKLDWRDIIRDMSRDAKSRESRSWSRPNRRRLGADAEVMPGYGYDTIYKLIVCFDVSGSVSDSQFREMKSEVAAVLEQNLINSALLIAVDTMVHDPLEITSVDQIETWKPRGGGGTCFDSAMAYVAKQTGAIGCIFLTDMQTASFGQAPDFPVVWVNWLHDGAKAPYGRTVDY
jgi:predicted metal-dependent peptidase